eukprot:scaffold123742_cov60-Phaeocystis_antarctica.AAC.1
MCLLHPCTTCVLRRSKLRGGGGSFESLSLASPGRLASHSLASAADAWKVAQRGDCVLRAVWGGGRGLS